MTRLTKLTLLTLVCTILSFSLFATNLIQNDTFRRISKTNWENIMTELDGVPCVGVTSNDEIIVEVSIAMARNDLQNFPALYVDYNFDGIVFGFELITAGSLNQIEIAGTTAYEYKIQKTIPLNNVCGGNNPRTDLVEFNYEVNLYTMEDDVPILYPVLYEGYPLFPGTLFPEVYDQGYTPTYPGQKMLCCVDASTGGPRGEQANSGSSSNAGQTLAESSPSIEVHSVYPNPVSDRIRIEMESNTQGTATFEVRDLNGRIVFNTGLGLLESNAIIKREFDLSDLARGIYVCSIIGVDGIQTNHKFVKM